MNLAELLGVKHLYDKSLDAVEKEFTKGSVYKRLGQGATATAFAQGDEYVYKFWLQDTAYEKYVEYCLDNQDNPHIPIFYSDIKNLHSFFTRVENFPDKIRYIKMERLKPINGKTPWPGIGKSRSKSIYFADYVWFNSIEGIFRELNSMIFQYQKDNSILSKHDFNEMILTSVNENKGSATSTALEEMYEVYKIMWDLSKKVFRGKPGSDYHSGNIMMRGKTIVINDPYADEDSMDLRDKIASEMDRLTLNLKAKKRSKSELNGDIPGDIPFKRGLSKKTKS